MARLLVIVAAAATAALAAPTPIAAQARPPIRVTVGWETRLVELAPISPDSPARAGGVPENARVYFAYDQLLVVAPFWTTDGRYVAHLPTDAADDLRAGLYEFTEQDPARLAKLVGAPEASLGRPFPYFVPSGWLVAAGLAAAVALLGRKRTGPHERFRALWADPRYRAGAAVAFGAAGEPPAESQGILLAQPPADLDAGLSAGADHLADLGVPRRAARRELEFLVHYMAHHQLVAVVTPPGPEADRGGASDGFRLLCDCGATLRVTTGMAGSTAVCQCGRAVPVPSLGELKSR
ncbi:MAG: hypothetical protein U0871_12520 [Gemmataceae bacterium]